VVETNPTLHGETVQNKVLKRRKQASSISLLKKFKRASKEIKNFKCYHNDSGKRFKYLSNN
jgi:hypothetical protein